MSLRELSAECRTSALDAWFASQGWEPFEFQREAWGAYLAGRSGLVHAPTGTGKTYGVWAGPILERLEENAEARGSAGSERIRVLWLTPMRALANDTAEALRKPLDALGLPWSVELRTGDTAATVKKRQRDRLPTALVTTPESLSILLSNAGAGDLFRTLRLVVVDEWHELLSTKRGTQTELCLARLRTLCPGLRTWGLSATLGNIETAARTLVGAGAQRPEIIRGVSPKAIEIETLLPEEIERYPSSGHLGTALLDRVIERIEAGGTTLLFTNTRSQTEIWFSRIMTRRPDLIGSVALHHASLDRDVRQRVELLLRGDGDRSRLKCVVCTSSLDLGVDFSPVDQVIQVGSPKGVARLIQRAGRSGHRPGAVSRIVGVPTHAFELVEFAAVRDAIATGQMEERVPLSKPLDVLAQHVVTAAMAGGFVEEELREEVRSAASFAELSDAEWDWVMDFAGRGGPALGKYPEYARIVADGGRWTVASRQIARRHRLGIGTIVSDAGVVVQYQSGRTLGTIEESFVSRLQSGDRFIFAGRVLEFVRLREMTAQVRRATRKRGVVPRWGGGRMPLSSQLADAVLERLARARDGRFEDAEMQALRPLLETQMKVSHLPGPGELLIERIDVKGDAHVFLFPFAGRLAHEGLGAMLASRIAAITPCTIQATVTDYGIDLVSDEPIDFDEAEWRAVLSTSNLLGDLIEALHATQLARRHFREIARIAGLTHSGYPGRAKPARHLQASSDMFFDVFREFDPDNLLLSQAEREVMMSQLEFERLERTLRTLEGSRIILCNPSELTPLSFPLWAETLRATSVSTQSWERRVQAMVGSLMRPERAEA